MAKGFEHLDHATIGDLAAHVQQMICAQQTASAGGANALDHRHQDFVALWIAQAGADADGVEHGGDARRNDLRVMRHRRQHGVEIHAGARHDMLLQAVGMKVDNTGHQIVAIEVDRAGGRARTLGDIVDTAMGDMDGALDHLFGKDDLSVGQDE